MADTEKERTMDATRPTSDEAIEAWRERTARVNDVRSGDRSPLTQVLLLEELAKGQPVSRERARQLLGASSEEIADLYEAIESGGGQLNDEGEFVGMALTLNPTRHHITINGNEMYAWCSLDTIFMPGLLETTGKIESADPITGEAIRLTVTADRILEVDPPGAVTSIFVPGLSPKERSGDLPVGAESEVCQSMLFYASRDNAERALADYPNIAIFTIEEAFNLAHETWTAPTRQLREAANQAKT